MKYESLSSIEKDALREIGNIGAGNAATSMSKLVNKKIDMQVPSVKIVGYDEMMELIGGPEETIVAMLFQIKGDVLGTVYFILSLEEAEALIKKIINEDDFSFLNDEESNEMAISALQEIGNIVTGSYLTALSDFTNINMQPSVPYLSIDMAGAVLTVGLLEISQVSDYAIIIDTRISSDLGDGIHGNFFLLPEPETLPKLFHALGIKTDE
ncbi:chemotaxis protein CheC [Oceanobacillus bengalensis]|uniref:Chemotaxis protein CheC n=1 Tax=Oceanobacillus bengalensis TaxID=1435466 RepID=A0A494Z4W0_9BACI|nr:chemotaxis protein CheC [Oceanobacillus bengalensis]RKQ17350.1 chemotaxis protein CheC [Oceanobacillus bengalensis]